MRSRVDWKGHEVIWTRASSCLLRASCLETDDEAGLAEILRPMKGIWCCGCHCCMFLLASIAYVGLSVYMLP